MVAPETGVLVEVVAVPDIVLVVPAEVELEVALTAPVVLVVLVARVVPALAVIPDRHPQDLVTRLLAVTVVAAEVVVMVVQAAEAVVIVLPEAGMVHRVEAPAGVLAAAFITFLMVETLTAIAAAVVAVLETPEPEVEAVAVETVVIPVTLGAVETPVVSLHITA